MSILYITNGENEVNYSEIGEEQIYIISTNENARLNNTREFIKINQTECKLGELKLGTDFLIGYKIMLTVKDLISRVNIDKIVFKCSYLDAYFTMQYLLYGGENIRQVQVCNQHCNFTEVQDNEYKFPYYWIKHLELKCKEMLDSYHPKRDVDSKLPMLSIIIPYYNLGQYIDETIESIRSSSYENYEIIIVNDGTTDEESKRVLDKLRNQKGVYIIDQENGGLSLARNIGARYATGKYITFLDADDLVEKDYYSRAINVLERYSDIDIVYSWVQYFESKDEIWPTFDLVMPYLLLSNMTAAFYVIRKEQFIMHGLNREEMKKGMEDYESLINMHINGCKGVSIPEPLVKYRYRLGSMSKSFDPKLVVEIYNEIIENHRDIYEKYSIDILKLINSNGPGYLWNNPTLNYPSVCLNANEDINDIKYMLIRLMNTRIGKLAIRILKFYKGKK